MLSKIGTGEIIVILIIALVIFGPDKLPQLGRSVGRAIGNVKKFMNETTSELKDVIEDIDDIKTDIKDVGVDVKTAVTSTDESSTVVTNKVENIAESELETQNNLHTDVEEQETENAAESVTPASVA